MTNPSFRVHFPRSVSLIGLNDFDTDKILCIETQILVPRTRVCTAAAAKVGQATVALVILATQARTVTNGAPPVSLEWVQIHRSIHETKNTKPAIDGYSGRGSLPKTGYNVSKTREKLFFTKSMCVFHEVHDLIQIPKPCVRWTDILYHCSEESFTSFPDDVDEKIVLLAKSGAWFWETNIYLQALITSFTALQIHAYPIHAGTVDSAGRALTTLCTLVSVCLATMETTANCPNQVQQSFVLSVFYFDTRDLYSDRYFAVFMSFWILS